MCSWYHLLGGVQTLTGIRNHTLFTVIGIRIMINTSQQMTSPTRLFSASTIFDQCEYLANDRQPVFQCLITQAAEATHYQLDDTRNRILDQSSVMKPDRRTGLRLRHARQITRQN